MTTKADPKLEAAIEQAASDSFIKANVVREAMIKAARDSGLSPQGLSALCITVLCEIIATYAKDNLEAQETMAKQLSGALLLGVKQKFLMDNKNASTEAEKPTAVH